MEPSFLIEFARTFFLGLWFLSPVLVAFLLVIVLLGRMIGKREGWSRGDAIYYAFITASTVGYGDFRPRTGLGKTLAIVIALCGLLLTGIVVAISLQALNIAFKEVYDVAGFAG